MDRYTQALRRFTAVTCGAFGFIWATFSASISSWPGVLGGILVVTGAFAWAVRPTVQAPESELESSVAEIPVIEYV